MLSALCGDDVRTRVVEAILRETTTIGVRFDRVQRTTLSRETAEVDTVFGRLPIKLARLGDDIVNAAPEYEPCRDTARAHGVSLDRGYAAVVAAWERDTNQLPSTN